jgi:hypothetical protein
VTDEFESEPVEPQKPPRDPADTLRLALLVYIVVNLLIGIPLMLIPVGFLDFIGVERNIAEELAGLRWVGAVLVAWGIGGVLVMARPVGRAYFVTVGALQMTFAAVTFLYSWWTGESLGSVWFQTVASVVLVGAAAYLWWARLRARSTLALDPPTS